MRAVFCILISLGMIGLVACGNGDRAKIGKSKKKDAKLDAKQFKALKTLVDENISGIEKLGPVAVASKVQDIMNEMNKTDEKRADAREYSLIMGQSLIKADLSGSSIALSFKSDAINEDKAWLKGTGTKLGESFSDLGKLEEVKRELKEKKKKDDDDKLTNKTSSPQLLGQCFNECSEAFLVVNKGGYYSAFYVRSRKDDDVSGSNPVKIAIENELEEKVKRLIGTEEKEKTFKNPKSFELKYILFAEGASSKVSLKIQPESGSSKIDTRIMTIADILNNTDSAKLVLNGDKVLE